MVRLWLIFAQAATIAVAVLFVVSTFRPEWLPARHAPASAISPGASAAPAGAAQLASYHEAVQHAMPSVVNVFTSKEIRSPRSPLLNDPVFRRFFGDQLPEEASRASSLGSGVIVSTDGFILTNHHVVEAADEIEVGLADGRKFLAKVVGSDPDTDLAVLRVSVDGLPAINFGSSEALRVGDVVLAIGNPFNLGHTVTAGIVSALGRSGLNMSTYENFIQTDAAINPGNSGGALVDSRGDLVGINTLILSRTGSAMGIGFAIPVSTARMVLDQIVKTGTVTRGWVGVEVADVTPAELESVRPGSPRGALIARVLAGGPAAKAGLKTGDILLEIDGRPVADQASMLNLVAALAPGSQAKVKLRRKEKEVDAVITVGRRPKQQRND